MVLQLLSFEVDRQSFGLPLGGVERVLRAVASTPLPKAPPVIEGFINLGGAPVAVLDLRRRFDLAPKPVDLTDMLIVARAGDRRVAVRADRVMGVVKVDPEEVRDPARLTVMADPVAGLAVVADGVVLIQDPEAFLTHAEAIGLDRAMAEAAP